MRLNADNLAEDNAVNCWRQAGGRNDSLERNPVDRITVLCSDEILMIAAGLEHSPRQGHLSPPPPRTRFFFFNLAKCPRNVSDVIAPI